MTTTRRLSTPHAVRSDEGEARWWFGSLAVIKATAADTGGQFTIVEVTEPPGAEAPLHVHHREDEAFWILEGERHARGRRRDDRGERGRLRVRPARDPAPLHRRARRLPDAVHLHPGGLREPRPRDERAGRCPDAAAAVRRGAGLGARRRGGEGEPLRAARLSGRQGARIGRPACPCGILPTVWLAAPPRRRRVPIVGHALGDPRTSAPQRDVASLELSTAHRRPPRRHGRRLDRVPAHRDALLAWLNAWGCRIRTPRPGEPTPFQDSRRALVGGVGRRVARAAAPPPPRRATSSVSARRTRASPPWR